MANLVEANNIAGLKVYGQQQVDYTVEGKAGCDFGLAVARASMLRSVAVEGVFYSRFANTTLILGEARGVVIATCAAAGLQVFEHEPRRVKQAVAGWGGATKEQMQKMVVSLLGMQTTPPEDAADALAIAICHIQSVMRLQLEGVKAL